MGPGGQGHLLCAHESPESVDISLPPNVWAAPSPPHLRGILRWLIHRTFPGGPDSLAISRDLAKITLRDLFLTRSCKNKLCFFVMVTLSALNYWLIISHFRTCSLLKTRQKLCFPCLWRSS